MPQIRRTLSLYDFPHVALYFVLHDVLFFSAQPWLQLQGQGPETQGCRYFNVKILLLLSKFVNLLGVEVILGGQFLQQPKALVLRSVMDETIEEGVPCQQHHITHFLQQQFGDPTLVLPDLFVLGSLLPQYPHSLSNLLAFHPDALLRVLHQRELSLPFCWALRNGSHSSFQGLQFVGLSISNESSNLLQASNLPLHFPIQIVRYEFHEASQSQSIRLIQQRNQN